jgi:hypothetical protein
MDATAGQGLVGGQHASRWVPAEPRAIPACAGERLRRRRAPRLPLERLAFVVGHGQRWDRATRAHWRSPFYTENTECPQPVPSFPDSRDWVIGAGFRLVSDILLTKSLLIDVWSRLEKAPRTQLRKIIEFHHPGFTVKWKTSFPDIEQLHRDRCESGPVRHRVGPRKEGSRERTSRLHAQTCCSRLPAGFMTYTSRLRTPPGYPPSWTAYGANRLPSCPSTGISPLTRSCSSPTSGPRATGLPAILVPVPCC